MTCANIDSEQAVKHWFELIRNLCKSFDLHIEAKAIEKAVQQTLADGLRTADLAEREDNPVSTDEFARAVAEAVV